MTPFSVNLLALLRRLKRTWRTLVRSARIRPISFGQIDLEAVAVLGHERLDGGDDFLDHLADVEVFEVKGHLAGLDLREIEDAVDEAEEMGGGVVDAGDVLDVFLAAVGFGAAPGAVR